MPTSPAARVAHDLHALASLIRRVLEGEFTASSGEEASFTQISILRWLDSEEAPRRPQDVARFLAASTPAATQILGRLPEYRTRRCPGRPQLANAGVAGGLAQFLA